MYPARVDERGRLKLPAVFQTYLKNLPSHDQTLFATSFDRRVGLIFTRTGWKLNKELLSKEREKSKNARRLLFTANDLGSNTDMDGQGRVLLSPELRRALGVEDQAVRVCAMNEYRIEIYSDAVYNELRGESDAHVESDVDEMEQKGLV